MEPRLQNLYKLALKDNEYIQAIKKADNDTPPTIFSSKIKILTFTTVYYGYLVGTGKWDSVKDLI